MKPRIVFAVICFAWLPSQLLAQSAWSCTGTMCSNGTSVYNNATWFSVQGNSPYTIQATVVNTASGGSYPYLSLSQNGPTAYGIADWPNASLIEGSGTGGLVLDGLLAPIKFQYGRVTQMAITGTGVGIGTSNPQHALQVAGAIGAQEVIVSATGADYVFDPGYRLPPLTEVAAYVKENHHLPEIPSAKEAEEKGVSLGEMQSKLLAKIEELTLHMIQSEKENQALRDRLALVEKRFGSPIPGGEGSVK